MRPAPAHAQMTQFPIVNGELVIGGVPLTRLAERAGQTPFYAYDRQLISQRITDLRASLPAALELHYAMKANPMPALVAHVAPRVDGIDVASGGELKVALDAGARAECISFAGPGKSTADLRQAVAAGALINVESFREVDELRAIGEATGYAPRIAIRINPDFELKSSGMKMGGGAKPFGVDAESAPALLQKIAANGLVCEGFHLFAGAQNLKTEALAEAFGLSYELVRRLADHCTTAVRIINLGGGFGLPYFPGDQHLVLPSISATLSRLVDRASNEFPGTALAIELGRYLVGEAGIYVSRIVDRKISRDKLFLVVDGGLHHHLSASGNFGQIIRKNYPVAIGNRMDEMRREAASVVGPLCTPLDVLADNMELAISQPGDLFVVFLSGAYGLTASPQAFLGHSPCTELLV